MIERLDAGSMRTVVERAPPLWACQVCERTWRFPRQPEACGFCAAADERDDISEVRAAEAIADVSPALIEAEERQAFADEGRPLRLVAGLASFPMELTRGHTGGLMRRRRA